ncbi:MAG: VPLPA-CTERM sorting domain-containing protein [Pseudomonadota bacterium]
MKAIFIALATSLLTIGAAQSAIVPYSSFADFQAVPAIVKTGFDIVSSTSYTTNAEIASNNGEPGAFTSAFEPMTFSGFLAIEVGMIFGNDQSSSNITGIFDVTLEAFFENVSLGSVTVLSNGNDLADQFIGFASSMPFDRVELTYARPDAGGFSQFISEVRISTVPLPPSAALLLTGFAGVVLATRRKAKA